MTYVVLNGSAFILKTVSFGRIRPADEEQREYWTCESAPNPSNLWCRYFVHFVADC